MSIFIMNKKCTLLWILLYVNTASLSFTQNKDYGLIHDEQEIVISEKTNTILYRYYLCKRIKFIIKYLKKKNKSYKKEILNNIEKHKELFFHPILKKTIKNMQDKNSLAPYFDLWKNIKSYQHLEKNRAIQEFISLTYLCCQSLHIAKKNRVKFLKNINVKSNNKTSGNISFRFYIIKRLKRLQKLIENLSLKPIQETISMSHFNNQKIKNAIKKINDTNTIQPLNTLYNEIKSYALIDNPQFLIEFLQLNFILLKHFYEHNKNTSQQNHLGELSINDLLNALDVEYNRVKQLNIKQEKKVKNAYSIDKPTQFLIILTTLFSLGILIL